MDAVQGSPGSCWESQGSAMGCGGCPQPWQLLAQGITPIQPGEGSGACGSQRDPALLFPQPPAFPSFSQRCGRQMGISARGALGTHFRAFLCGVLPFPTLCPGQEDWSFPKARAVGGVQYPSGKASEEGRIDSVRLGRGETSYSHRGSGFHSRESKAFQHLQPREPGAGETLPTAAPSSVHWPFLRDEVWSPNSRMG